MGILFGTDGVRGIANTEITCELAMKIGRAAAVVLSENTDGKKLKVLIGTDTRKSAHMLSAAISAGFCSVGCDVLLLGVVPTPAVAFLVREYGCDAGVMISASHNTSEYNGIKIFRRDGYKLPDETEDRIEAIISDNAATFSLKTGGDVGKITIAENAADDYIRHVASTACARYDGMKIAVDCANGSASSTAEKLFTRLGAGCSVINNKPDGININDRCGSTHIEGLQQYVRENGFDIGLAFDGDADRLLCVDGEGNTVDGDKIIAVCAKAMKAQQKLDGNTVVVTVMSNMGLLRDLESNSINYECTAVGDRYVLERMLEEGYSLGGEQSGHVIFTRFATTGDGQLTAVQLLDIIKTTGKTLKELTEETKIYPQVLINVEVSPQGKLRLNGDEYVEAAVKDAERQLAGDGRVLVRASGTEPLVRIMIEGSNSRKIQRLGQQIAGAVRERLI